MAKPISPVHCDEFVYFSWCRTMLPPSLTPLRKPSPQWVASPTTVRCVRTTSWSGEVLPDLASVSSPWERCAGCFFLVSHCLFLVCVLFSFLYILNPRREAWCLFPPCLKSQGCPFDPTFLGLLSFFRLVLSLSFCLSWPLVNSRLFCVALGCCFYAAIWHWLAFMHWYIVFLICTFFGPLFFIIFVIWRSNARPKVGGTSI